MPSIHSHKSFANGIDIMTRDVRRLQKRIVSRITRTHRRIGEMHRSEAVPRVPVDTSNLKQRLLTNTYREGDHIITETGTNVEDYPIYVEFGTEYIAGGRVLALGKNPRITDAEAIKNWPAKEQDGGEREQMPWLRPSWMAIEDRAIAELTAVLRNLGDGSAGAA